jgi:hypothetical protein
MEDLELYKKCFLSQSSFAGSEAFSLIMEGYHEFLKSGVGINRLPFGNSDRVAWIRHEDVGPIAAIVFDGNEELSAVFIRFAYVSKSYRQKGLFKSLMLRLKEYAFENKLKSIMVQCPLNPEFGDIMANSGFSSIGTVYAQNITLAAEMLPPTQLLN